MAWENREKGDSELWDICKWFTVSFEKKNFIPSVWQAQSKVIYLKMKGDYYCYLVQVTAGDDKKGLWISHSKPTKMLFKTEKENATKNILLYWVWAVNSLCSIVQSKLPRESLLSCKESFFPLQFYWNIIDILHYMLRCTTWSFEKCICCKMITTISWANIYHLT